MTHLQSPPWSAETICRTLFVASCVIAGWIAQAEIGSAQAYLDNESIYSNQDSNTETRRSDHFRINFGHYNRDTGTPVTERLVQGNLQMFEQAWNRWVVEMGMHDINESVTNPDGNKYRANFNILMTWDDGGGGGAYSSMDSGGFGYAMANSGYCRFDPPSGATPHEFGHAWQVTAGGFNGSNSSGSWWEAHANWMQLQFLNSYPQAGGYLYNSVFYPAHGRDYYDSWMIFEAAREDSRYGPAWVNEVWTNATPEQQVNEYIIDRMIRLDSSGSADKAGAVKDLWGDMARKMVTWDYERQRWLAQANTPWHGDTWEWYTRCRAPLVRMPGTEGWYRPAREHMPQQFGFHFVPLTATPGTTVSCNFQPLSDFVRQSDWRACLVAVNTAGEASYSSLWNIGTQSITLSSDQDELYLMVIAVPKPMKIADPAWLEYTRDSGLQFPYAVSFTNSGPLNVTYPAQNRSGMHQHPNGGGWVANSATVDATSYVGPNAQVLNTAQVLGNARIEEYAVVRNNAVVSDNAVVSGHAMVYENARVSGNAKVRDWAMVCGSTELYENAKAIEHAGCGGGNAESHNKVFGNAVLKGVTSVYSPSTFSGSLITDGDTANGGTGDHGVHFGWQWGQNPAIFTGLADNGYQYSGLTFERDNPVFAMDQHGINHGYLMNGCRTAKDSGAAVRGGRVLPLDGVSQYVELHNSISDFKESTFAVWCKPGGGPADQRIWSLGDGGEKVMYLTPNAAGSSALRFVITDGTSTHNLDGPVLGSNVWQHVAVVFSGTTCTLYVNGAVAATHAATSLFPDSLNAPLMENANYLGRGNAGNFFQGSLDDFQMFNKALGGGEVSALFSAAAPTPITIASDATAPSPNAATWLVAPLALGDSVVTMSATPGTDASGWVEYYFACVSGGGHDSGWVSFNKFTDVGIPPGAEPAYTVRMRDRNGNTTGVSAVATATLATSSAGSAGFSHGPVGIADGRITMTAIKAANASGKIEYKFDRSAPTAASSGWQSSPTWTQSGLAAGASHTYTVTIRDGRGNTSSPSAAASAIARDDAGPALPIPVAHWQMLPYATIDNKISMTATEAYDPTGVEYFFHCSAGGGPDSGWQASPTFVTPAALPDGSYIYQYKLRDKSARGNESAYSNTYTAKITPTTGYHNVAFAQLASLQDDCLVTFNGVVMRANSDHYLVKDVASDATITVRSDAYALATDSSKELKLCQIKGHLWTHAGTRLVTYASLTTIMDPPAFAVSGKVAASGSGTGIPGATVYFSSVPGAAANATVTATCDADGNYSKSVPNGTWHVSASGPGHFPSAEQTIAVVGAAVQGVHFSLDPAVTITAMAGNGGSISPAGAVLLTNGSSQSFTISPNGGQSISSVLIDGVEHGSIGSYTFNGVTNNHVIAVTFSPNATHIPLSGNLLHSALAETFPASGPTGAWASHLPAGLNYPMIGSPVASMSDNAKWAFNSRADGDGFDCGDYGTAAIPCSGASIVAVVKPLRNSTADSWNSIVDIFYNRFVLGIYNNTGRLTVWRNGVKFNTTAVIPNGQVTVLSLVCQPDGKFKLFANGVQVHSTTSTSPMTSLVPGVPGSYATHINVGRNNPDGWTTFNGSIGDFFIYDVSLGDAARQGLERDMAAKFGIAAPYTITASAGAGGTISPAGVTAVPAGGSATFAVRPDAGFAVQNLSVDGVSLGSVSSHTFTDVAANHVISAAFTAVPTHVLTSSAGPNGSISPAGTLLANAGSNQTFTISPATGYQVADVRVDGVSQGAVTSHTFTNIGAAHTISAAFSPLVLNIAASAAAGGTISPAGTVGVNYGASQTFTITPNANHAISGVMVDGVDVGPVSSYGFESVIENHSIAAVFIAGSRRIPAADQLFVALDTSDIVGTSSITSWPWRWPAGNTLTKIGSPTVQTIDGARWESNLYADGDGFRVGQYSNPIAVSGSTAICAIKPVRNSASSSWTSVVDVMYGELVLGISNVTGLPTVRLKKSLITGPTAIPNGQATILSLVVQPGGAFTVRANGEVIMTGNGPAMTEWKPGNTTGNPGSFDNTISIGRNGPDGWTTFNGNIGDVFLYKTALTDTQRIALEADLMDKFAISGSVGGNYTITASAGTGGTITPAGSVSVPSGSNQAYVVTPDSGYEISEVWIDGIPVGVAGSYTFTNVLANHMIAAAFRQVPADIILSRSPGTGNNTTYGDSLGFVVNVAGTPFPTGSVTVRDGGVGGAVVGSGMLANGSCTINPAPGALNAGLHENLVAVYSGDSHYPAMASAALDPHVVNPLPVTVMAVVSTKTYDGTTTATGTPSLVPQLVEGDSVTLLNQRFLTKDSGVGNRVIVPSITIDDGNGGSNYAVTLQNFTGGTIFPAPAAITLGDLEHTHDGTPKAASASTDPAGLAVEFTYDSVPTPPVAPGSYSVVATIADSNHTGSTSGTLVIVENAMSAWRSSHFTAGEIAAGLAADDRDPDGDGATNLAEFAFNGDPRNGSSRGLLFRRMSDGPDDDSAPELEFTCAVRRGAGFSSSAENSRISLLIDGILYRVEGSLTMTDPWDGVISDLGASDTAPVGSGLPDLTGSGWQYHTFSAFNGLQGRGFVRVRITKP
jgi:carbonic anhydrase/acetyltransferase-like protein (isoleucine patch superfamily)